MTRNSFFAILITFCYAASAATLPVSAAAEIMGTAVINRNDHPCAIVGEGTQIIIETDGTVLTEEMVNFVSGFSSLELIQDIYYDLEINTELPEGNGITYSTEFPEENGYIIYISNIDKEQMLTDCRKLMLELDCIENAFVADWIWYSDVTWINYAFNVTPVDPELDLSTVSIPELQEFTANDWGLFHQYVLDSEETTAFAAEMEQKTFETEYERFQYLLDFADAIQEKYSDVLAKVEPAVEWAESSSDGDCTAYSAWHTAGDPNADGEVTAADASDMLMTAAKLGAGADAAITSAEDVNADGTVDALDAAAVLTYAAAQGSGNPLSWAEILR